MNFSTVNDLISKHPTQRTYILIIMGIRLTEQIKQGTDCALATGQWRFSGEARQFQAAEGPSNVRRDGKPTCAELFQEQKVPISPVDKC